MSVQLSIHPYRLALKQTLHLSASCSLTHRSGWLIQLKNDRGLAGWGEVAPLPGFSRETVEEAQAQLQRLRVSPELEALLMDPEVEVTSVLACIAKLELCSSVCFGLETASCNLLCQLRGCTLAEGLGRASQPRIAMAALLRAAPDQVCEEAQVLMQQGYKTFKIKVNTWPVEQIASTLKRLRAELDETVQLRIDANRAWTLEQALYVCEGISELDIAYLEEPLQRCEDWPSLMEQCACPLALDESLRDLEPGAYPWMQEVEVFVLKPSIIGGIAKTLLWAEYTRACGARAVLSSAYESGVATSMLLHLAGMLQDTEIAAGLDTYKALAEDVLTQPLAMGSCVVLEGLQMQGELAI